jgi:hypothetical protein
MLQANTTSGEFGLGNDLNVDGESSASAGGWSGNALLRGG